MSIREPRGRHLSPHLAIALLLAAVVTGVLAVVPSPASGSAAAGPVPSAARPDDGRDFPTFPDSCRRQGVHKICRITRFDRRPWLVLWGDSHALQYLAPVTAIARQRRVNVVSIYSGACPLSLPFPARSPEPRLSCDKHNEEAFAFVRDLHRSGRKVRVILGSYWHFYRRQHARLLEERRTGVDSGMSRYDKHLARLGVERSRTLFRAIGKAGIRADVLAQSGVVPENAPACAAGQLPYLCDLDRKRILPRALDNRRWLRSLSSVLPGTPRVIDPVRTYCGATVCHGRVRGLTTYYDRSHLGMRLTRTMRPSFRPSFARLLDQH